MVSQRVVNVFWRPDGTVLFDEVLPTVTESGRGRSSVGMSSTLSTSRSDGERISAQAIWSLVQVFIQFSREVDGGKVRRLVFRDPAQQWGTRRVFASTAVDTKPAPFLVVVHVAHDNLFVTTCTERVPPGTSQLRPVVSTFPVNAVLEDVLMFFNREQSHFTEEAARDGTSRGDAHYGVSSGQSTYTSAETEAGDAENSSGRPRGVVKRADALRSYVSRSSSEDDLSYPSHPSESFSEDSSASSESDEDEEPSVQMMPLDSRHFSQEVHRILEAHVPG